MITCKVKLRKYSFSFGSKPSITKSIRLHRRSANISNLVTIKYTYTESHHIMDLSVRIGKIYHSKSITWKYPIGLGRDRVPLLKNE